MRDGKTRQLNRDLNTPDEHLPNYHAYVYPVPESTGVKAVMMQGGRDLYLYDYKLTFG